MKKLFALLLCILLLFTGCGSMESSTGDEFQKMAETYDIADLITEPPVDDGEECAMYMDYIADSEIPFVELISIVYNKKTDEVTKVIYDYYYLMEGLGYSTEEEVMVAEELEKYMEEALAGDGVFVNGNELSFMHAARVTVGCFSVDNERNRDQLVKVGLLETNAPVSYKATNRTLLGEGYVKR